MKLNQIHFIEKFAIVTFPIALAVGCTTTSNQESNDNLFSDKQVVQEYSLSQDSGQILTVNERDDDAKDHIPAAENLTSTANENDKGQDMKIQTVEVTPQIDEKSLAIVSRDISTTAIKEGLHETILDVPKSEANIEINKIPQKGTFSFQVNKYDVATSDHEALRQHARYLEEHANLVLYVDGFSDNRGPAYFNYQLSKQRSEEIADLLTQYGAPPSRMKINGYGASFPIETENNWDENRRVELEYGYIAPSEELFADLN
jgi:outer membrane protein OmpA-like peptidoglycan-associated protein